MKDSNIDPERLAALIDGRLTGSEREEVITQLARSDDSYEIFVDAAGIVRELEDKATPWWRRGSTGFLAIAAGLVGIAALSWTMMQRSAGVNAPSDWPVALLTDDVAGLPAEWNDVAWPRTRGARTEALTADSRAARIGARLVDLELALRKPDQRAAGFAEELASTLDAVPGGAPIAAWYRSVAQSANQGIAPATDEWSTMRANAEAAAGQMPARQAAWAETARIAAMRHDASFFSSDTFRPELERALVVARAKPAAGSLPPRLSVSVMQGADWDSRVGHLTLLVRVLGS